MSNRGRRHLATALLVVSAGCTTLPDYDFTIPDGAWMDGGSPEDSPSVDARPLPDAAPEAGRGADFVADAGPPQDAGGAEDAGPPQDAGAAADARPPDAEVALFVEVQGLFETINGDPRPVGEAPSGTASALHDFDGDGRVDWLIADHRVARGSPVYRQHSAFEFRVSEIAFPSFQSVLFADIDGDGAADVVATNSAPAFGVFTRASDFRDEQALDLPYVAPSTLAFSGAVVDLDADHRLDVLLSGNTLFDDPTRGVPVFMNRQAGLAHEDGHFEVDVGRLGAGAGHNFGRAALGDYDGDGDADLALVDYRMAIFEQTDGRWIDRSAALGLDADGPLVAHCGAGIRWVDFDVDGDLDLAWNPGNHCVPRARTHGTFLLRNEGGRFALLRSGPDLDDGVAVWPARNDPLCWWVPSAGGAGLAAGSGPVIWLDIDLDGDDDIFVPKLMPTLDEERRRHPDLDSEGQPCAPSVLGAAIYESRFAQGEAAFRAHPLDMDLDGHNAFTVDDLDGDGDPDIAMSGWNGDAVPVWLLRNTWVERGGAARWLTARALTDGDGDATDADTSDDRDVPGVMIELDLDGPAEAPDFARGLGRLRVAMVEADGVSTVRFGLGAHPGPFWLRARFPDGSDVRVRVEGPAAGAHVVLRDCARAQCPP